MGQQIDAPFTQATLQAAVAQYAGGFSAAQNPDPSQRQLLAEGEASSFYREGFDDSSPRVFTRLGAKTFHHIAVPDDQAAAFSAEAQEGRDEAIELLRVLRTAVETVSARLGAERGRDPKTWTQEFYKGITEAGSAWWTTCQRQRVERESTRNAKIAADKLEAELRSRGIHPDQIVELLQVNGIKPAAKSVPS